MLFSWNCHAASLQDTQEKGCLVQQVHLWGSQSSWFSFIHRVNQYYRSFWGPNKQRWEIKWGLLINTSRPPRPKDIHAEDEDGDALMKELGKKTGCLRLSQSSNTGQSWFCELGQWVQTQPLDIRYIREALSLSNSTRLLTCTGDLAFWVVDDHGGSGRGAPHLKGIAGVSC